MTYLEKIIQYHKDRTSSDHRNLQTLINEAKDKEPARNFLGQLKKNKESHNLQIIAEIKKATPSKGFLSRSPKISTIENWAKLYEENGASCISVLTDRHFFHGDLKDIETTKKASKLPVLRKDFILSSKDVAESRIYGADAILLIVNALSKQEIIEYFSLASDLGMSVLIEIHDESEIEKISSINPQIIGVNQRNLKTFEVNTKHAIQMLDYLPEKTVKVVESGIEASTQTKHLKKAGYDAGLVGEAIITNQDPKAKLLELTGQI